MFGSKPVKWVIGIMFFLFVSINMVWAGETVETEGYYTETPLTALGPSYMVNSYDELVQIMAQAFSQRETEFTVDFSYTTNVSDEISNALSEIKCMDPYDYWHYAGAHWSYSSYSATIYLNYKTTPEEEIELEDELHPIIAPWLSYSTYDKIRAVHDWMVNNLEYDTSYSRYTAYEAFFDRLAVCEGYSLLAYKMLSMLNVDVAIVRGKANGGAHMWNIVKLCCATGCQWFHLDVTWDDPLPGGMLRYDYFLISDAEISQDHTIEENCGREAPVDFDSWESLCTSVSCDASHLDLCTDSDSCSLAGGYWCSDECRSTPCPMKGDISGDNRINIIDALLTAQCAAGIRDNCDPAIIDVNCDGYVTIIDALLIARKGAGLYVDSWCE